MAPDGYRCSDSGKALIGTENRVDIRTGTFEVLLALLRPVG